MRESFTTEDAQGTFEIGRKIGSTLAGGELILLRGGLGAGKTLMAKGILDALGFDVDEVTSPSFALVNLYKAPRFDVYHIDLWRLDGGQDAAAAVGLDELLDEPAAVTIIEWPERLAGRSFANPTIEAAISGDGDEPRVIEITDPRTPRNVT